jgi:hypothetical protein
MHWIIATILTMTALGSVTAHAMTGGSVDAKFRGTWVPASAACTSPLQLVIEANKVTFVHGAQRRSIASWNSASPAWGATWTT